MDFYIVGLGNMGQKYLKCFLNNYKDLLKGVVVRRQEQGEEIKTKYNVPYFTSLEDIDKSDNSAVIISTPSETHFEFGRKALELDFHCLIEKPICPDFGSAKFLLEEAQKRRLKLMGGHTERLNPTFMTLRGALSQIGELYQLKVERSSPYPPHTPKVGVARDLLIHDLDLMIKIKGQTPKWVYASKQQKNHPNGEDGISALYQWEDKFEANLTSNWLSSTKTRDYQVIGSQGQIKADFLEQKASLFLVGPHFEQERIQQDLEISQQDALTVLIQSFLKSDFKDTEKWAEENVLALALLEKTLLSAELGEKLGL